MRIDKLSDHIGAEVRGVDIGSPVDAGTFSLLREAFHRHSVLVFRGQEISDEQQVAFSEGFGPLEMTIPSDPIGDGGPVGVISNVDGKGHVIPPDDKRILYQKGNSLWHSDGSFRKVPLRGSLLSAREVPPTGGETEYASLRAAYAGLSDERKALVEDLAAEHSIAWSRQQIAPGLMDDAFLDDTPPAAHPLVRAIPEDRREGPPRRLLRHPRRRLASGEGPRPAGGAARLGDAAALRLPPRVAAARPGHVGQRRLPAPRPALGRPPSPGHAPHHPFHGGLGRRTMTTNMATDWGAIDCAVRSLEPPTPEELGIDPLSFARKDWTPMAHNRRSRWNWSPFPFPGTRARAIVARVVPLFLLFHPHVADAVPPPPPVGKRWVLVWSDDFNGTTLDASKWNHRSEAFRSERRQSGHRIRWRYEHDNVSLRDSYLVLRNTRDPLITDGADLVKAAAIDSKGKFEQTYGYFEASVRIAPTADGMHSAFWLQNDNRYRTAADGGVDGPSDGAEIDILESVYTSDRYVWAVHWEGNSIHADEGFAPMHDGQFHVFAVAWTPDSYTFYADGQRMAQTSQGVSHSDGYVILSTGVSWQQGNARAGTFPNEALVDWVRVYELQDIPAEPPRESTVVLEPPDPRGPRDIGRITLVSSQPGTIQARWEAPSEAPANYRISWAKAGEEFKTWTDQSGNAFPTATSHTITGLEEDEEYKVMVRASYNGTAGDWSDQVSITVAASPPANDAPTADAGSDQTVQEGSAVTLSGTAYDADNDTLTYQWTHDRDELDISLSDPASLSTTFTTPQVGSDATITFTLTATDEHGATGSDAVAITVQDTSSEPPQGNTVVLEPPDPRDSRDIGSITLVSSQPGTIQARWEAPREAPANYRISWAKAGEEFKTWTDRSGNAFPTATSQTITGLEEE